MFKTIKNDILKPLKNTLIKFIKKTFLSRKGISWAVFLTVFIFQEYYMNKGLLEVNKWSMISKALDIVAILLVLAIIVVKDINISYEKK